LLEDHCAVAMIDQPRVARVPFDHVVGVDAFGGEPTTYPDGNLLGRYRHVATPSRGSKR
jgi:hypothetical protein